MEIVLITEFTKFSETHSEKTLLKTISNAISCCFVWKLIVITICIKYRISVYCSQSAYLSLEVTDNHGIKDAHNDVSCYLPEFSTEKLPKYDARHFNFTFDPAPGCWRWVIIIHIRSINIKSQRNWQNDCWNRKMFNFVNRTWSYLVFRYMDSAATISNFLKLFNNLTLACEVLSQLMLTFFYCLFK